MCVYVCVRVCVYVYVCLYHEYIIKHHVCTYIEY